MTHDREFDHDNPAHERIWNDSAEGAIITPADPVRHSREGLMVLFTQGVRAYQRWVRHRRSSR